MAIKKNISNWTKKHLGNTEDHSPEMDEDVSSRLKILIAKSAIINYTPASPHELVHCQNFLSCCFSSPFPHLPLYRHKPKYTSLEGTLEFQINLEGNMEAFWKAEESIGSDGDWVLSNLQN